MPARWHSRILQEFRRSGNQDRQRAGPAQRWTTGAGLPGCGFDSGCCRLSTGGTGLSSRSQTERRRTKGWMSHVQTRGGTSTGGGASPLLPADGREDCEKTRAAFLWGTHVEVIRQFDSELLGALSWIVSPAQRSTTSGPCAKKKPTGVGKLCVVGAYTPHNESGFPSLMHNSPPWRITCWLSRGHP